MEPSPGVEDVPARPPSAVSKYQHSILWFCCSVAPNPRTEPASSFCRLLRRRRERPAHSPTATRARKWEVGTRGASYCYSCFFSSTCAPCLCAQPRYLGMLHFVLTYTLYRSPYRYTRQSRYFTLLWRARVPPLRTPFWFGPRAARTAPPPVVNKGLAQVW